MPLLNKTKLLDNIINENKDILVKKKIVLIENYYFSPLKVNNCFQDKL